MADLELLQSKLGVRFTDPGILDLALIHSSYINENPGIAPISNERLEFLGDAVLGLVIAERLYQDYPHAAEGELTRFRSALVRRETLSRMARLINLGEYLNLGIGEEAGGGRDKPVNLAGALESVIAAVYLDQGLEISRAFILELLGPEIDKQARQGEGTDYKSRLQENIQARYQLTPTYNLTGAVGPDHAREFTVEVRMGGTLLGRGQGKSKKAAEMDAARAALEGLFKD
jgi:ribonuclease III